MTLDIKEIEADISRLKALFDTLTDKETTKKSLFTDQKGGDHYKKLGQYQPWLVLPHWLTPEELKGFMKGTVIAYLAREQDKGGNEDIEKAYHTLGLYLETKKTQC